MSGPLIPFIEAPEIPLGFLDYIPILGDMIDASDPPTIKPFGTLVALGVYLGSVVTMNRARERGLDTKMMSDFIFWVVASGFVISHMLDAVFYHPHTVAEDPLYLFKIWDGLSSYGGFIGAIGGTIAWKLYRKKRIMEFVDVTVSAFPLAWVFGRTGCAVVHDHPGRISDSWLAVQYPHTVCPEGFPPDAVCGRFDLGLIEMVLTIPLAVACIVLWRRKPNRPHGFYCALTLLAYAPVRFGLDFLRVDPDAKIFRGATDPRYAGLTPAQWACFLAVALGLYFVWRIKGRDYQPTPELMAQAEEQTEEQEDDDDEDDPYAADPPKPKKKTKKKRKKRAKKKESPETREQDEESPAPGAAEA